MALFTGCSEQATESPTEPQFGKKNKVTYDCADHGLQDQLEALNEAAESIFMSRPTIKGALSNIDNTARKVCVVQPNYEAALEQYWELEILVNGQNISKLRGGEVARQAFLNMAYSFATGGDYNPGFSIPPEALGPDGGLFVVPTPGDIPAEGLELVAGSFEGALRIFPGTFPPEAFPVTIVEYRLPDDYDGSGDGYSFGGYIPLPEIWWFEASAQPDPEGPGFDAWVCLVEDLVNDPYLYDRSVLAHSLDGGGVELLEKLPFEDAPADLNCANAGPYQVAVGPTAPSWLQLAGTVVRPVLKEIFGVKKLNAMYFAGKGLGGRGGSLSPFWPVDALGQPEFDVSCEVSGGIGTVSLDGGEALCGAGGSLDIDTGNIAISTFVGSKSYPAGSEVTVATSPGTGYELASLVGCDGGVTDPCIVTVNGNRSLTATFTVIPGDYALTLAGGPAAGTILGYYTAPRADPLGDEDISCTVGPHTVACTPTQLPAGTTVRLVAQPDVGSTFDGWSDACEFAAGNECWLAMYEDKAATASFVAVPATLTLTVPARVEVTDGASFTCDGGLEGNTCQYDYGVGDTVTLEAVVWPEAQGELWLGGSCAEGQY
jgi:hypothetical protein